MGRALNEYETNKTVSWVHFAGFRWIYCFSILMAWWVVRMFITADAARVWMIVLASHTALTFVLFHWIRGQPEGGLQGESVAHLTFWEQIDGGVYGTPTRKFLIIVPVLLFFIATYNGGDNLNALAFNGLCTAVAVVPKHVGFHNVRLFGINKQD